LDYKELTTKPESELKKMLEDLRAEAHDLKMKISLGEAKTSHKLKGIKKDIARIMTFFTNKK
jgi:ribosomal protein L29